MIDWQRFHKSNDLTDTWLVILVSFFFNYRICESDFEFDNDCHVVWRIDSRITFQACLAFNLCRYGPYRFRSLVKDVIKAHRWVCVHPLSFEASRECDVWFMVVNCFVGRFESCIDAVSVGGRGGLCVEITHEEYFIRVFGLFTDPKQNVLNLQPPHVIVPLLYRMVQVSVDKDEIAVWVLWVPMFDHVTVSDRAYMQNLVWQECVSAKVG